MMKSSLDQEVQQNCVEQADKEMEHGLQEGVLH